MTSQNKERVKGKKFSQAVTENKLVAWDGGLSFEGSALPELTQRAILKDWLLSSQSFQEVCLEHGMTITEATTLKAKLPHHIVALKKAQEIENFELTGRKTNNETNRLAILVMLSDGMRFSRHLRVMSDLQFQDGTMTSLSLGRIVSAWDKLLHRMGTFLTEDDISSGEGLRALMQMTKEELGDLKSKIQEYRHYKVEIDEADVILESDKNE